MKYHCRFLVLLLISLMLGMLSGCYSAITVNTKDPGKVEDLCRYRTGGKYGMRGGFMVEYDYNIKTAEVRITDLHFIQDDYDLYKNRIRVIGKSDAEEVISVFKKNKEIVDQGGEWVHEYHGMSHFKRGKYPMSYGGLPDKVYDFLEPGFTTPDAFRLTSTFTYQEPLQLARQVAVATGEYIENQAFQDMMDRKQYTKACKFIPYFSHPSGNRLVIEPLRIYLEQQLAKGIAPEEIDWEPVKSKYGAFNAVVMSLGPAYVDYAKAKKILNYRASFEPYLYTPKAAGSLVYYLHVHRRSKSLADEFLKGYIPHALKTYPAPRMVEMLRAFAHWKKGKTFRDQFRKAATRYYVKHQDAQGINALMTYFSKTLKHQKTTRYMGLTAATAFARAKSHDKALAVVDCYRKLRGKKAANALVVSLDQTLKKQGRKTAAKAFMAAYTRKTGDRGAETTMLANRDRGMVKKRDSETVKKTFEILESYSKNPARKENYGQLLNEIVSNHLSGKKCWDEGYMEGLTRHYLTHGMEKQAMELWKRYYDSDAYGADNQIEVFTQLASTPAIQTLAQQLFATHGADRGMRSILCDKRVSAPFRTQVILNSLEHDQWWGTDIAALLADLDTVGNLPKAVSFLKTLYDKKPEKAEELFVAEKARRPPALFQETARLIARDAKSLGELADRVQIITDGLQPSGFKDQLLEDLFKKLTPFSEKFTNWTPLMSLVDHYLKGGGSQERALPKLEQICDELARRRAYGTLRGTFIPVCKTFALGRKLIQDRADKAGKTHTASGVLLAFALDANPRYRDILMGAVNYQISMGRGSARVRSSESESALFLAGAKGTSGKAMVHTRVFGNPASSLRLDTPLVLTLYYSLDYKTRVETMGKSRKESHNSHQFKAFRIDDKTDEDKAVVSLSYTLAKEASVLVIFTQKEYLVGDPKCTVSPVSINGLDLGATGAQRATASVDGASRTSQRVVDAWEGRSTTSGSGGSSGGMAAISRFFYLLPVEGGWQSFAKSGNPDSLSGRARQIGHDVINTIDNGVIEPTGPLAYTTPYTCRRCASFSSFVDTSACEGIMPHAGNAKVMKIWATLAANGWLIDLQRGKLVRTR